MKRISLRTCEECSQTFSKIPLLTCGHFVCGKCYCRLKANRPNPKSNQCGCPICGQNMMRRMSNRI